MYTLHLAIQDLAIQFAPCNSRKANERWRREWSINQGIGNSIGIGIDIIVSLRCRDEYRCKLYMERSLFTCMRVV
jgi:hypothetical protein